MCPKRKVEIDNGGQDRSDCRRPRHRAGLTVRDLKPSSVHRSTRHLRWPLSKASWCFRPLCIGLNYA